MRSVCFSIPVQHARKISGATALPEQNRYKKVWAFPLYSIYRIHYIIDADRCAALSNSGRRRTRNDNHTFAP